MASNVIPLKSPAASHTRRVAPREVGFERTD